MAQRIAQPTVQDGTIIGPLRRSVNQAQEVEGSIHNDAVASKLGFRGGTVAGSIHLELFPPLMLEAFGDRWFERGTISINFRNATTNEEPVRAIVTQPAANASDVQVAARIEREDGMLVGEGTASVGDVSEPTALGKKDFSRYDVGELRILEGLSAGDEIPAAEVQFTGKRQLSRLDVITEPLTWYSQDTPWGGPLASPASMVELLYAHPAAVIGRTAGKAVGLFGAIELRHVNGPVLLDRTYEVSGRVIFVGESPKTEYVWFESYADAGGKRVAEMLMQLRWMKASSELYQ